MVSIRERERERDELGVLLVFVCDEYTVCLVVEKM